jgi:hypothetical protein
MIDLDYSDIAKWILFWTVGVRSFTAGIVQAI